MDKVSAEKLILKNEENSSNDFKAEILNDIENYISKESSYNLLVSGYRGVGKTSYIDQVIQNIKTADTVKENPKHLFIKHNIDKYGEYSLLIRQLIRGIYLNIQDDSRFEKFKNEDKELYEQIENLHRHSFFEIYNYGLVSSSKRNNNRNSFTVDIKKLLIFSAPILLLLILPIYIPNDIVQIIFTVFFVIVWPVAAWSLDVVRENVSVEEDREESKTLYDDEIAEYHFLNIISKLREKEIYIHFIFDEMDKIEEDEKLYKTLSDIKFLLLSENCSSIVISGQSLFYQFAKSNTEDDALLSNLFTKNIHIPLESTENIRENYLELFESNSSGNITSNFIDSLILKSKRVNRSFNNLFSSFINYDKQNKYIKILKKEETKQQVDSKLLTIISDIERAHINPIEYEQGIKDFLIYQTFIFVEKIKIVMNQEEFNKESIYTKEQYNQDNFSAIIFVELEIILSDLIKRMIDIGLLEKTDENYRWKGEIREELSSETDLTLSFIEEVIRYERILRQMSSYKKRHPLRNLIEKLLSEKIIDAEFSTRFFKIYELRSEIVHGANNTQLKKSELSNSRSFLIKYLPILLENYLKFILKDIGKSEDLILNGDKIVKYNEKYDFEILLKENKTIYIDLKAIRTFNKRNFNRILNNSLLSHDMNTTYINIIFVLDKRDTSAINKEYRDSNKFNVLFIGMDELERNYLRNELVLYLNSLIK